MTVFGTRPEIIRLSLVIEKLDRFCDHTLVHTGQNYDPNLSDVFFRDLGVRPPNVHLGVRSESFVDQIAQILTATGELLVRVRPDRVVILGDTNSGLAAIVAARKGIPVYHMEAGNRCYDDRVPEEINRRIIDHCSSVLMPYTHRSKENLLREGIARDRIFVIGNPIYEVLAKQQAFIERSRIHDVLRVCPQQYLLATLHRAENVDGRERLARLLLGLELAGTGQKLPVVVSLHPHTRERMKRFDLQVTSDWVRFIDPVGFHDFIRLERSARCVITDSGTVQEECCIFGIPNVTIRDVTERAETVECGSNILTGADPEEVAASVGIAMDLPTDWKAPEEYRVEGVSTAAVKIVLGYVHEQTPRGGE